jgi:hypothetical protein
MADSRTRDNKVQTRLKRDEKELVEHGASILSKDDGVYIVMFDECLYRVYVHSFPYRQPVIQPVNELKHENHIIKDPWTMSDWSPAVSIYSVLLEYRDTVLRNLPYVMTDDAIPNLLETIVSPSVPPSISVPPVLPTDTTVPIQPTVSITTDQSDDTDTSPVNTDTAPVPRVNRALRVPVYVAPRNRVPTLPPAPDNLEPPTRSVQLM